MDSYSIQWKKTAAKELRSLPKSTVTRIISTVESLTSDPFPAKVRKLVGARRHYRIRVGDYRVIYSIQASLLIIEIIRVGHRRDVYKH